MKTKDLLFITLKIIGIMALWQSIQTFGAVISGIGISSSLFSNMNHMNDPFMIAIGLTMILKFVLPLAVALILLFRTEKVMSLIKIKEQDQTDIAINKLTLYHMIVIVFGFVVIIHGTGNFMSVNYKTDTKTENVNSQEKVSVTNSKSKNVNYFAFLEILFGIVLLAKATDISKKIERNFDSKTSKTSEELNI